MVLFNKLKGRAAFSSIAYEAGKIRRPSFVALEFLWPINLKKRANSHFLQLFIFTGGYHALKALYRELILTLGLFLNRGTTSLVIKGSDTVARAAGYCSNKSGY